jgi:hypothetical protein
MKRKSPRSIKCLHCGETFITDKIFGRHENCPRDTGLYMPWNTYLAVLCNLRDEIKNGAALSYWDSEAIGDKDNECTWGLCTKSKDVYPDPDMHVWPWQFEAQGRHAPKYRQAGQHCPMCHDWQDQAFGKPKWEAQGTGCFYSCRLFTPNYEGQPSRERAIALIDQCIQQVKMWIHIGLVETGT